MEYTYDEVGNRTHADLVEPWIYTSYTYDNDPRYRISSITHSYPRMQQTTVTFNYTRDGVGNPTTIDGVTYGYDANSRLASRGATSYTYDWVGNRVTPGNMVYDPADRLTSWPNQHQYTYLGTGSMYQQKNGQGTVQKTFAYTPANLMNSER